MKDQFCDQCGCCLRFNNLREVVLVEARYHFDLFDDFSDSTFKYRDTDYDNEIFVRYECNSCGVPVTPEQERQINEAVGRKR